MENILTHSYLIVRYKVVIGNNMKISLTPEAYQTLFKVSQEMKITAGELVSHLIMDFSKVSPGERDSPTFVCGFCSLAYYSKENLQAHIKRRHSDKMIVRPS